MVAPRVVVAHATGWQGAKKKKIGSLRKYPTSIACLAFSPNGEQLAVAASYTYEQGERAGVPPDAVYLTKVTDALVKPKAPKV